MPDDAQPTISDLPDANLLRRFVQKRCEIAFRELVERHGPLVLSVCRRNTFSSEDAEDAFQAAFLVLAQSAGKVRRRESLSAWLYGVALRVSARVRRGSLRSKTQPLADEVVQHEDPLDELLARHDGMVADEELSALPEPLRTPLVLRYLAGKNNHEVAEELGISVAALEGRLKRGKQRLRARLLRRGVTLTAVVAALKSTRVVANSLPESLAESATALACGPAPPFDVIPEQTHPSVTNAALEELNAMNALLIPKSILSIALASVVTLAVGLHLANSQGPVGDQAGVRLNVAAPPAVEPTKFAASAGLTSDAENNVKRVTQTLQRRFNTKTKTLNELRIEDFLDDITNADFDFVDAPLEEVVEYLRTKYKIPVILDMEGLQEVGVDADEPVTIHVPKGPHLRSVLSLTLSPLHLEAIVHNEVLLVTSQEIAASKLDARIYSTRDLGMNSGKLKALLKSSARPASWEEGAQVEELPSGDLLIRQSYAGHREVTELLRQVGKQPPAPETTVKDETPKTGKVSANKALASQEDSQTKPMTHQQHQQLHIALARRYSSLKDTLRNKQSDYLAVLEDTGSVLLPQNALRNQLDIDQIGRLQSEVLRLRGKNFVANSPPLKHLKTLEKEIEQLSEQACARAEQNSDVLLRKEEIDGIEEVLQQLGKRILDLETGRLLEESIKSAGVPSKKQ